MFTIEAYHNAPTVKEFEESKPVEESQHDFFLDIHFYDFHDFRDEHSHKNANEILWAKVKVSGHVYSGHFEPETISVVDYNTYEMEREKVKELLSFANLGEGITSTIEDSVLDHQSTDKAIVCEIYHRLTCKMRVFEMSREKVEAYIKEHPMHAVIHTEKEKDEYILSYFKEEYHHVPLGTTLRYDEIEARVASLSLHLVNQYD